MDSDAFTIQNLFINEDYNNLWLKELSPLKSVNYIIFDQVGVIVNGKWIWGNKPKQTPCVKNILGTDYAIYDTRYHEGMSIEKYYSELMHEVFHCYQICKGMDITKKKIIEGGALFVEMIFLKKYTGKSIHDQFRDYKNEMLPQYADYYFGAYELYEQFLNGYRWRNYFKNNMNCR